VTVTLVSSLQPATAAAVLRGVRRELALERPGEGCMVFAGGISVESAAGLAPLLRGDSLEVEVSELRLPDLHALLESPLGMELHSLLLAATCAWGGVSVCSTRPEAAGAVVWLVRMDRDKKAERSAVGFQRTLAAVKRLFAPENGGAEPGVPSLSGAWSESRNHLSARVPAAMGMVLRGLLVVFREADPPEMLLDVGAPFPVLQRIATSRAEHRPARFKVRGEFRPEDSNLDPKNLQEALSLLGGNVGNTLVSFSGLRWRSFPVEGGTLVDSLDLVCEREGWALQLRTADLLERQDRAAAVATARRVLREVTDAAE
jgi:hypothetical protein